MAGAWDDTLKKLVADHPEDIVHWLFVDAVYEGEIERELPLRTIHADFLFAIILSGIRYLLHFEFQRDPDPTMAERLLEYNVQATRNDKEHRPTISCVIYLKKHDNMPMSPLVRSLPDGDDLLRFHFKSIKPWEHTVEGIKATGLTGMLLFLPLTEDGATRAVVTDMVDGLLAVNAKESLSIAYMVANLVLESEADANWLKEQFSMLEDIFQDTMIYQEIFHKGEEKGVIKGRLEGKREGELNILRQTILDVAQVRFPAIVLMARGPVEATTDVKALQNVLLKISLAKDIQEAFQALLALGKMQRN